MLKTQPVVSPLLETTLDVADEQPAVSIADKPMLLLMGNPILDPLAVSGADLVATDTRPSLLQPLPNSVPDVRSSQLPARQIAESLAAPAEGRIEVRLDPEELGTVKVTLVPDGDRMRVMIVADRPETMELLRRNSNDLAQEFRTIGYDTTSFSFGQSRRDNQSRDGFAPADVDLTEPAATSPSPVADGSLDLRL
ncbi:MAG: flagellar hook-length control protein FliK [Gemmobacter sp.]|nr:flagellar hook-length control protein FliK [Gemmobacter sp.]